MRRSDYYIPLSSPDAYSICNKTRGRNKRRLLFSRHLRVLYSFALRGRETFRPRGRAWLQSDLNGHGAKCQRANILQVHICTYIYGYVYVLYGSFLRFWVCSQQSCHDVLKICLSFFFLLFLFYLVIIFHSGYKGLLYAFFSSGFSLLIHVRACMIVCMRMCMCVCVWLKKRKIINSILEKNLLIIYGN